MVIISFCLQIPIKRCRRRPSERSHRVTIMTMIMKISSAVVAAAATVTPLLMLLMQSNVEKLKGDKCLPVIVKQLYAMHIRMMKLHFHASSLLFLTHIRHLVVPSELTTDQFCTHITTAIWTASNHTNVNHRNIQEREKRLPFHHNSPLPRNLYTLLVFPHALHMIVSLKLPFPICNNYSFQIQISIAYTNITRKKKSKSHDYYY